MEWHLLVTLYSLCLPASTRCQDFGDYFCHRMQQCGLRTGGEVMIGENSFREEFERLSEKVTKLEKLMTWYKASDGRYYKIVKQSSYSNTAQCREQGAILASIGIRDPYVRRELRNLVKHTGNDTWIGLNDIEQEGIYVWADGVLSTDSNELEWAKNQPSDTTGSKDCVYFSAEENWKLRVGACSKMKYALCQKYEPRQMDWQTASNGKLYKVFLENVGYDTARVRCQDQNAILASAGVRDDIVRVEELRDMARQANGYVWVGLNDIDEKGQWVWEDGVLSDSADIDWAPGEPSSSNEGEDCVHFLPETMLTLSRIPCDASMYYMCEKTLGNNFSTTAESDWKFASNGMSYKVFMETKTYFDAKQTCLDHGASLACVGVTDPTVVEELRDMVRNNGYVWIGLNDISNEGIWVWEDGLISRSEDIDWAAGEPSNSDGEEDCVHFSSEANLKFNDLNCSAEVRFLCERQ